MSLCAQLLPVFALARTAWQPTVITSDSQSNVSPPSLHLYGYGVPPYLSLPSALMSMKVANRHLISVTHAHTDTHTRTHPHLYTHTCTQVKS